MMVCRTNRCRTYLVVALAINILVLLYLAFVQHSQSDGTTGSRGVGGRPPHLADRYGDQDSLPFDESQSVTIVIREFEEFENEIVNTVLSIKQNLKNTQVVVIGDKFPYPPLSGLSDLRETFHFVSLRSNLWQNMSSSRPEAFLNTKYVLIVPDATAISDVTVFKTLIRILEEDNLSALAIPFETLNVFCSPLKFDYKKWTLEFVTAGKSHACNNVVGDHAMFMRTDTFLQLSQPLLRPIPLALYIQGSLKQWSVKVVDAVSLSSLKPLYQNEAHNRWKHKHNTEERLKNMYKQLGIRLVIQDNGRRQWYGCSKDTERCFDTVLNDMPEYLYEKRWTPPCCMRALRETSKHVFSILDSCQARYWLEGGSLLGAARHGDIIPWDYDVDIGMYLEDVDKCDYLRQCTKGSYLDESGYIWEKAREGEFYRVQYSETNRLHVDIYPFFSRNGTMTKNTWMKTHKQDTEFPEHFLKPLTKVRFAGLEVKAPNNVKTFLEFKFGAGVIEHPKYPNAQDPV